MFAQLLDQWNGHLAAGLGILYCIQSCNRVLFPVFQGPVLYPCTEIWKIEIPENRKYRTLYRVLYLEYEILSACQNFTGIHGLKRENHGSKRRNPVFL